MKPNWYVFASDRLIPFPIAETWRVATDFASFPTYWRSIRSASSQMAAGDPVVGGSARFAVKGFLPHELAFEVIILERPGPHALRAELTGELFGAMDVEMHPQEGRTRVHYTMRVAVGRRWLNLLGGLPLARRLLESNHEFAMERGFQAQERRLEQEGFIRGM